MGSQQINLQKLAFQNVQHQFCSQIRKTEFSSLDNNQKNRMNVYRSLLFNNVCSFIDTVYPISKSLLGEEQWNKLLEAYFERHQAQTPFHNEIAEEFKAYLINNDHPVLTGFLWLNELMHYEWLELYLDIAQIDEINIDLCADWQMNKMVWVLVYEYPVYLWNQKTSLEDIHKQPSAILVWRNEDDLMCQEQISPLFAFLVNEIQQKALTKNQLISLVKSIKQTLSDREITMLLQQFKEFLITHELIHNNENRNEVVQVLQRSK